MFMRYSDAGISSALPSCLHVILTCMPAPRAATTQPGNRLRAFRRAAVVATIAACPSLVSTCMRLLPTTLPVSTSVQVHRYDRDTLFPSAAVGVSLWAAIAWIISCGDSSSCLPGCGCRGGCILPDCPSPNHRASLPRIVCAPDTTRSSMRRRAIAQFRYLVGGVYSSALGNGVLLFQGPPLPVRNTWAR